ncbi:WSC domain-containing protein [Heterostelium album PN500]|uniref:WSC domain-containing protein n=1 Tax=Heterostelium pallidum (strain ATCC 26659 / Pp 5 / PN500) TaxID=670386 RepID=D3BJV6_HETP5|nr:WSC domain-containing protein [Heterostelium album PN500]EFA78186.1 WSC domain-containing protein [Heterostelium album PN500]|eukprot:XP_020430312.1 WSC domain-containing protein [Heterostelium album PN500]
MNSEKLILCTLLFIISSSELINGYGEPDLLGNPVWQSRASFLLVNAVRIDPLIYLQKYTRMQNSGILDPNNYPAVPPLYWENTLGLSSLSHSVDMADNNCFSHPSCDGTDTFQRIQNYYQCSPLASENIAAGLLSPLDTNNQWICDSGSGDPYSTYCAPDGSGDGHRANIMSRVSRVGGVGYGTSYSSTYHTYWTQDFGEALCFNISFPIHSGSHIFMDTKYTIFMVSWYSEHAPRSASIVIDGKKIPLQLDLGTRSKGIYRFTSPIGTACRGYYFLFESRFFIYRYPNFGYLQTYGEGSCDKSFSYNGTEYHQPTQAPNTITSRSTGSTVSTMSTISSITTASTSSTSSTSAVSTTTAFSSTVGVIPSDSPVPTPTIAPPTTTPFKPIGNFMGCFNDQVAHDLSGEVVVDTNLTNHRCLQFCSSKLFQYAGTSFGNLCYCGNSFGYYGQSLNQSDCSIQCAGNNTEKCGGINRLSIYKTGYVGCYDSNNAYNKFVQASKSENMTSNGCRTWCKSKGYEYSATTNQNTCLCAESLDLSALKTVNDDSKCKIKCISSGENDYCGSDDVIIIYQNKYLNTTTKSIPEYSSDEQILHHNGDK